VGHLIAPARTGIWEDNCLASGDGGMPDKTVKATKSRASGGSTAPLAKGRCTRIIAWAIVLTAGWVAVIQVVQPEITQAQNQFAQNVIDAERFVYEVDSLGALVVGSSMADDFDTYTDGRVRVLGMNGMSAREGLQVLRESGRVPSRVAIELNCLTAPANDAFLERVFNQAWMPLRRHILALRMEYQPASVVTSLAKAAFGKKKSDQTTSTAEGVVPEWRLEELRRKYANPPSLPELEDNLRSVRETVKTLERNGVKVVYYEYPVPHGLANTPFHTVRREVTAAILGPEAANPLTFDEATLSTRDGIHLTASGQRAVAIALERRLNGGGSSSEPHD
jgi:hypothetical protein